MLTVRRTASRPLVEDTLSGVVSKPNETVEKGLREIGVADVW